MLTARERSLQKHYQQLNICNHSQIQQSFQRVQSVSDRVFFLTFTLLHNTNIFFIVISEREGEIMHHLSSVFGSVLFGLFPLSSFFVSSCRSSFFFFFVSSFSYSSSWWSWHGWGGWLGVWGWGSAGSLYCLHR